MILRLVMLGDGTPLNPFRADLQNYSVLGTDQVNMTITVSASRGTSPAHTPPVGAPYWSNENGVNILVSLPQGMLTEWWQRLAASYPDQSPPFMPGFPVL